LFIIILLALVSPGKVNLNILIAGFPPALYTHLAALFKYLFRGFPRVFPDPENGQGDSWISSSVLFPEHLDKTDIDINLSAIMVVGGLFKAKILSLS